MSVLILIRSGKFSAQHREFYHRPAAAAANDSNPADYIATTAANDDEDDRNHKIKELENNNPSISIMNQQTNVIFKYSYLQLTEAINALLNRTLIFSVLHLKLDIPQVLVAFNKFARAAI